MEALNAAGRRVSLLNDDGPRQPSSYTMAHAYATPPSGASSPTSPQLWRSGSYDSQMSGTSDAVSPLTPALDYTYTSSAASSQPSSRASNTKRPLHYASSRSTSNEDEIPGAAQQDRPAKRYPCRFRDSHGCEKTFTTSGHASRHSKIHTAEKAVQCTFPGCQKKFTRADNMKQHLETHYKDKSRGAGAHRGASAAAASSTAALHHKSLASEHRRPVISTARSRSSSSLSGPELDVRQYALPTPPPLHSPAVMASGGRSAWEMTGATLPMHSRPSAVHAPKSGLDALAMAVACQEGS
ncbi:hypothetical protein PWT90_02113 [Aphanocladium album]|nr:hypothetical protein PWT90_02113 [Aphanocladium album]